MAEKAGSVHFPLELRGALTKRLRDCVRFAEARIRRRLPPGLGGRLSESDITARRLSVDDAKLLAVLLWGPAGPDALDSARASLLATDSFHIGLFRGDALVAAGSCSQQWSQLDIPGWWFGGDHVHRRWRRRGLGQLLHRARLREAEIRDIEWIYVNTRADNHAALGALRAVGFREINEPEWERRISNHLRQHGGRNGRQVILARGA